MFGGAGALVLPQICSTCMKGELELLSSPQTGESHLCRLIAVPNKCARCDWGIDCFRMCGKVYTHHVVCLPTTLVVDCRSVILKYQASRGWGTKPANAHLQLASLICSERDPYRQYCYQTVGLYTILSEAFARKNLFCCFVFFSRTSSPWRPCTTTPKTKGDDQTPAQDSDGEETEVEGPPGLSLPGEESPPSPPEAPPVPPPPADGPSEGLRDAELAAETDRQQAAHVSGDVLMSSTVEVQGTAKVSGLSNVEGQVGARQATSRFPSMSDGKVYLHDNSPENLRSSHALRGADSKPNIGVHRPSVDEAAAMPEVLKYLTEHIFTPRNCKKAMAEYTNLRGSLPRKLSEKQKDEWHEACLLDATGKGLSYSKFIDAFVKSEVTGKNKPRPIANDKEIRLCALAKIAWVYESVFFHAFEQMSIKHRPKKQVMQEIARNMGARNEGVFVENDLSSFEFGIGEALKKFECDVLRHIANTIGVEEGLGLMFERVCHDRERNIVWRMSYTDAAGEKKCFKLVHDRPMRASGDRLTSSGNFLQNLLAWVCFLVAPSGVHYAMESLKRTHGKIMHYCSARDGKRYFAMLVFEGDDTLGRLQEDVGKKMPYGDLTVAADFFYRWGWVPKLSFKKTVGDDYARFVGYDFLIRDGKPVQDLDGELVCCPEVSRILRDKAWTTQIAPNSGVRKLCMQVYAKAYAEEFTHIPPMYNFMRAIFDDNQLSLAESLTCRKKVTNAMLREVLLKTTGEMPDDGNKEALALVAGDFPSEGASSTQWRALCEVAAGACTDLEWATACAAPDLRVHGKDLAMHYPKSWLEE